MLITKSEFARRVGVSPVAVGKAVKSGRLTLINGKLDEKVAALQWDANRQRPAPPPKGCGITRPAEVETVEQAVKAVPDDSPDVPTLEASRRRREFHEANLAEMRERQKAGELVALQEVHLAYTTLAAEMRAALERIPDKIAPRLASAEPADVHDLLTAELDQVLADMVAQAATLPDRLAGSAKAQT